MDNQHKMIKGYRDLSQEEIDMMNKIKTHAKVLGELVEEVRAHLSKTCKYEQESFTYDPEAGQFIDKAAMTVGINGITTMYQPSEEQRRWQSAQPYEWLDRAKDDLQDGFMKLTRAVAQPTTF